MEGEKKDQKVAKIPKKSRRALESFAEKKET